MSSTITSRAPAKINLTLHITGQRDDGYHLLDSLVIFADYGDDISVRKAEGRAPGDHRLTLSGPFSEGLEVDDNNLVLKAARLFGDTVPAMDIHLVKKLPVASGIGGGSADAAATLRAISELFNLPMPSDADILSLGADVPVCAVGQTVRMRGIGEEISPVETLSKLFMVLVNPGVSVSTPAIFKALTKKNNPELLPFSTSILNDTRRFSNWLQQNRNDLEKVAAEICPDIQACLDAIAASQGLLLHRMSGSGATCFGLFETQEDAENAASVLEGEHPDWWVVSTALR